MSTFLEAQAYDLATVQFSTYEGAESAEYTHNGLGENISLTRTLWGETIKADLGQGFLADSVTVWIIVADMVDSDGETVVPQRGATVKCYPGDDNLEEIWTVVESPTNEKGVWRLELEKNIKPVPR